METEWRCARDQPFSQRGFQRRECGDAACHDDLFVDDERWGAHDPVGGDLGVVGDLLDLGLDAEFAQGLFGELWSAAGSWRSRSRGS